MTSISHTLSIDLDERSYPILIGQGLISDAKLFNEQLNSQHVLVVTNETIAPLYLEQVKTTLGNRLVETAILPDGEAFKSLEVLEQIFDALVEGRFGRDCCVVALGGGVIGDMAGFAAASYQRGVKFVQIPTTLLAQVDSSVGGKTAVNHPGGKNMIGAFHQPTTVLIDTDVLATLPDKELSAGLAEVIKYGFIRDAEFFSWLENNMDSLLLRDRQCLEHAISRSCEIKAAIVAADEHEHGIRALLNLGHTFGHAIETAQGYGNWLHGEAVAAGTCMALTMSAKLGWIDASDVERGRALLAAANLPLDPPRDMNRKQFLDLMARDKKVRDGRIRLVLLNNIGEALVSDDYDDRLLYETIDESLSTP